MRITVLTTDSDEENYPTGDSDSFLCNSLLRAGSGSDALSVDSPLCWSTQALAMPTASARTRAITPTRSVTEMAPRASRMLNRCEHFRHKSYAPRRGNRILSRV